MNRLFLALVIFVYLGLALVSIVVPISLYRKEKYKASSIVCLFSILFGLFNRRLWNKVFIK